MPALPSHPEPQQGLQASPDVGNEQPNPAIPLPNIAIPTQNEDDIVPMEDHLSDADDAPMDFGNDNADPVAAQAPNAEKEPNTAMREHFQKYLDKAERKYDNLPTRIRAGIELCQLLNDAGTDLALYDRLMDWHFQYLNTKEKVTYGQLIKRLRERNNLEDMVPKMKRTTLPACGTKVSIPCMDFEAARMDLLTDPRVMDSDYLFFNDDPYAGPPPEEEWKEIRDINTGLCYRETYDAWIKPKPYTESGRRRVLDPIVYYMDGCTTGNQAGGNLSLELVKFTSCLFNRKARNKRYCWRNLGAVPKYVASKTKAKELIAESGHKDAELYLTDSDLDSETSDKDNNAKKGGGNNTQDGGDGTQKGDNATQNGDDSSQNEDDASQNSGVSLPQMEDEEVLDENEIGEMPTNQAQNLHHILSIILDGFKKVQDSGGIEWDLYYKGELHRIQLVPFVIFIKGDSVEQDKHCGKYGSKGKGIQSLCRHCLCPAAETDMPYAEHPRKTQTMISELVRNRDEAALKGMSQSLILNAWYSIKFGAHNDWGVHGATPLEILHWIQINMFGYSRDNIFNQTGRGELGKAFNETATAIGWLMQRQSDKDYPRTKFTNGVMKGKLTGHEKTGMMLVLAAAFRCTKGRKLLLEDSKNMKKQEFFPNQRWLDDWLMLLETQLELEQWLKKDVLPVEQVKRMKTKMREIMSMNKVIGKRDKGMGNKTFTFHGAVHYWEEILNFGVPDCYNTMGDEMRHKEDKKDAGRTQKRPKSFELQAMQKIEERRIIELGIAELVGRKRWQYKQKKHDKKSQPVPLAAQGEPKLTGVLARIQYNITLDDWTCSLKTGMKHKTRYKYPPDVLETLQEVAGTVEEWCCPLLVRAELKLPGKQIYRACPFKDGKAWYDWGLFRYRDATTNQMKELPGHIRAFIDLRDMTMEGNRTQYEPTIYLIVETVKSNHEDQQYQIRSDLFVPYLKCKNRVPGSRQWERTRHVWPIDRLIGPTCVIPDVGNKNPDAFFMVRPLKQWGDIMGSWINDEHQKQFEEPQTR